MGITVSNGTGDSGQGPVTIIPHHYTTIDQGTWALLNLMDCWGQLFWYNSSGLINDAISYSVYLAQGNYTLSVLHGKAAFNAIMKFKLDGTTLGTIDGYDAANTVDVLDNTITFSNATPGIKTLQVIGDAKNVASGAYQVWLQSISFIRTS